MLFGGFVLATEVAFVVVMRVVAALFIVVVAIATARLAIFWIIAAILIGMPGFIAMNVAWFAHLQQLVGLGFSQKYSQTWANFCGVNSVIVRPYTHPQ